MRARPLRWIGARESPLAWPRQHEIGLRRRIDGQSSESSGLARWSAREWKRPSTRFPRGCGEPFSTTSGSWPHCGWRTDRRLAYFWDALHDLRVMAPLRHRGGRLRRSGEGRLSTTSGSWSPLAATEDGSLWFGFTLSLAQAPRLGRAGRPDAHREILRVYRRRDQAGRPGRRAASMGRRLRQGPAAAGAGVSHTRRMASPAGGPRRSRCNGRYRTSSCVDEFMRLTAREVGPYTSARRGPPRTYQGAV